MISVEQALVEIKKHINSRINTRVIEVVESQGFVLSEDVISPINMPPFRQSAMDGDADAQYALAVMLQTGKGQPQDFDESNLWLQRAANLGHRAAVLALANTAEN